jgi:hypothetical protein
MSDWREHLTNKKHWFGVGRRARASGLDVEAVLTMHESVNVWIREGYGTHDRYPRTSDSTWHPGDEM